MAANEQKWGFQAAGDLLEDTPKPKQSHYNMTTKKVTPKAEQPVKDTAVFASTVTTPAVPKASGGFFMAAGDLLSAAEGHHAEAKGSSWDDFRLKDTVTVIVTDGVHYDTARVVIKVEDVPEITKITEVDDKPKQDTIKTVLRWKN